MSLTRDQIIEILASEKLVSTKGKFRPKNHPDYKELVAEVTCFDFPQFNFLYRCIHHCSRYPRKISHLLSADKNRIFGLDINPGASHRNLITLESVRGTHWQIGPELEAEIDERDRTPTQWHHAFSVRAGLKFDKYYDPTFESPDSATGDLFGDQHE